MKIRTLSPVHIGTGNENMALQYKINGNSAYFYKLDDLLSTVPPEKLVSGDFLNSITKSDSKATLDSIRRYIDYNKVKSKYVLSVYSKLETQPVFEQFKSLNMPFIPGSSIKGAIESIVCYSFIKKYFNRLNGYPTPLSIEGLLGKIMGVGKTDILKSVAANLFCDDICFKALGLYETVRASKKGDIPVGFQECIDEGQEVTKVFYKFNGQDQRLSNYASTIEKEFISMFKKENISKYVNEFTKDALSQDLSQKMVQYYYDTDLQDLKDDVDKYLGKIKSCPTNCCLLRIGKDTNCNFKGAMALLFKTKDFDYYKKNFNQFKTIGKVSPNTLPSTRTFFIDEKGYYVAYPGFLEIDFND